MLPPKTIRIQWSCNASVYNKLGMVYNTTLTGLNRDLLEEKKKAFIEKHREEAEVITFGNLNETHHLLHDSTNEQNYIVTEDEITNPYFTINGK